MRYGVIWLVRRAAFALPLIFLHRALEYFYKYWMLYIEESDIIADIKWQLDDRKPTRLVKIRFTCSRKFIFSRELRVDVALSMSEVKSFIR